MFLIGLIKIHVEHLIFIYKSHRIPLLQVGSLCVHMRKSLAAHFSAVINGRLKGKFCLQLLEFNFSEKSKLLRIIFYNK